LGTDASSLHPRHVIPPADQNMTHIALAVNRNVPPIKATSKQAAYSNMTTNITSSIQVNLHLPLNFTSVQKAILLKFEVRP
jgi:hypothetical protein